VSGLFRRNIEGALELIDGDASDVCPSELGDVTCRAAYAAATIEKFSASSNAEAACEVCLVSEYRLLEALTWHIQLGLGLGLGLGLEYRLLEALTWHIRTLRLGLGLWLGS